MAFVVFSFVSLRIIIFIDGVKIPDFSSLENKVSTLIDKVNSLPYDKVVVLNNALERLDDENALDKVLDFFDNRMVVCR